MRTEYSYITYYVYFKIVCNTKLQPFLSITLEKKKKQIIYLELLALIDPDMTYIVKVPYVLHHLPDNH